MSLIIFLILLSVLVLVHEAGHFFAARLFGIKVDEFGYGFPPRLFGFVKENGRWKRVARRDTTSYRSTIYSINWLPLGGFVRIKGEQGESEHDRDSFHTHPIWQRLIVLAAGVAMNALLAAVLFSAVFMHGTTMNVEGLPATAQIQDRSLRITETLPSSPAADAGLEAGDVILEIDGATPASVEDARTRIASHPPGVPFMLRIKRGENVKNVTTQTKDAKPNPILGVGLAEVGRVSFSPLRALQAGFVVTGEYTKLIFQAFGQMISGLFTSRSLPQDLTGPVGIAIMTGKVAQEGFTMLLQFAAILSINLAVLNILPIPALDGGRVLFLFIEKIRRRSLSRALEAAIHNVSFLILIALVIAITIRDVAHFRSDILSGLGNLIGR